MKNRLAILLGAEAYIIADGQSVYVHREKKIAQLGSRLGRFVEEKEDGVVVTRFAAFEIGDGIEEVVGLMLE